MQSLGKSANGIGEQAGKSAALLNTLGGAANQAGGKFADLGGKAAQLAGIMGTGGALGIAIGAATAAFWAASKAYTHLSEVSEEAQAANKRLAATFKESTAELVKQRQRIASLRKELANVGKENSEILRGEADALEDNAHMVHERLDLMRQEILENERLIAAIEDVGFAQANGTMLKRSDIAALKEENAHIKETAEGMRKGLKLRAERIRLNREEASLTDQTTAKKKAQAEAEGVVSERRKKAGEAAKKAAELEKKRAAIAWRELAELQAAEARMTKTIEEEEKKRAEAAEKAAERKKKADDEAFKKRTEAARAAHAAELERLREVGALTTEVAGTMGNAFGNYFAARAEGGEAAANAEKALLKDILMTTLATVKKIIIAKAAEAAAKQGAAFSSTVVGLVLAPAMATAMFALISGFANRFNKGGEVTGGTPGKDSVLGLLTPGEIVIPEPMARMFKQLLGRGGSSGPASGPAFPMFAMGGMVAPSAGGGGAVSLNVTIQQMIPDTKAGIRAGLLAIAPELSELDRRGHLKLGRAR